MKKSPVPILKIISASLLILALAWQHIQAMRLGYEVEKSRRQAHFARGRIGSLQMEMERSLSPSQMALHAKTQLGMFPAAPESLRLLEPAGPSSLQRTLLGRLLPKSWRRLIWLDT
jgi:hypothetical protein